MNIKDDLKTFVRQELGSVASPYLLNRADFILQTAPDDKNGLIGAVEKVSRIIALFIDTTLADDTYKVLRKKIDERQ